MQVQKRVSKQWYFLLLLGIIGGLIGFLTLRKEDKRTAENLLVVSIIMTVTAFAAYAAFIIFMFPQL